jgi:ATP-dependent DNA ligase
LAKTILTAANREKPTESHSRSCRAAAPIYSEHLEGEGAAIFAHVCGLGAEGIVSKHRSIRTDRL